MRDPFSQHQYTHTVLSPLSPLCQDLATQYRPLRQISSTSSGFWLRLGEEGDSSESGVKEGMEWEDSAIEGVESDEIDESDSVERDDSGR